MSLAEFIYTVVLKPAPLRALANATLRALSPAQILTHGVHVALNPNDPVISGALTLRVYERSETAFFQKFCRPGMTVLDVGANVGYYTALAMKALAGQGRVISLEPDPESFRFLQQTVALNGSNLATCVNKAAASQAGVVPLFTSKDNRGDNRLYSNELSTGSITVETVVLDDLLEELGVATVDLAKIDVQGYEAQVVAGMRRTMQNSPALTVLTEFWPFGLQSAGCDPEAFLNLFEEEGLRLFQMTGGGALRPLMNHRQFIRDHSGRQYANLVATKRNDLAVVFS